MALCFFLTRGKILGTDELFNYLDKYDLELDPHFDGIMGRHSNRPWQKFVNPENQHLVSEEAISFVGQVRFFIFCIMLSVPMCFIVFFRFRCFFV